MTNWKDAEDAYAAAMNSAGSAEKENQSFLNSIAGKQAQFKSAFESLSNDVINSDLVKFGVDMGTMMVNGLDGVINATGGGLGTVILGGLGTTAVKGAGVFTKKFTEGLGKEKFGEVVAQYGKIGTAKMMGESLLSATKGLGTLLPAMGIIAGVATAAAVAFKLWDDNTEQLTEAQQKLSNSLTNSNAARKQVEDITSQIAKNQEEIKSIEQGGVSSVGEASRVEQLKNENAQLGTKLTYQKTIADVEAKSAAESARRAINMDNAYMRNGVSTSTLTGKIGLAMNTLFGQGHSKGIYMSEAEHLDQITDNYIKTQDELNAAMKSGNQETVSKLQDELVDLNKEYSEGLSQQYEYLDAFTDKSTGKALSGFEKEYQSARNQINKMLRPTMGDNQFLNTILGYGEYDGVAEELTNMALNGGFSKGWENSTQSIKDFVNEVNASGMDNAANKIKNLFTGIANGSTDGSVALALVEDNFENVTEKINDFENRFSNTAAAAKGGFSSRGLSFGEKGILGSRYDSAIGATANGFRLNYSEFAKNRASSISRQRADNQAEIKELQAQGDSLAKAYQNIQDKIAKSNSRDARQGGLGAESVDELKTRAAQYAQAIKTVQSSIGNLNDAQIELSGLGSKLNTYLDTASGDYESTKNLDAVAASFANLKEEINRGWTSGSQARAFTDAWTYADMTKASNQEVSDSYSEAEANYKKFYDVTQNERSGKWESEINGTKILSELNSAGESLGKTFVGANKDIEMSSEDIANVAKVWGVSESMASELVGALDGFEGHSVSISKVGKSFDELTSGITKADSAMQKYSENNEASGYDSFESAYKDSLQKAKELEVDFSKTKYGNVNAGRNGIKWTEENLESNKSALESWGVNRDEFLGTTSSVFASSGEYGKNGGIPIAFTPLLETENGLEMLSKDTVDGYLETIAEKSQETGEDIFDLDASGAIEGFEGIKNLVAATGEEAEKVSQQMHFVGQDGEFGVLSSEIDGYLDDIQQARHAASQAGDTEAFQALNSELARTAELKAQIDTRDSLENNLLNFDETGKGTADFRQRVDMLQDAQEAIENLEATKTVDKYAPGLLGVDAVSTAEGAVDSANQAIAQYISENGLASNLEGLSPDATQEEIADYISGMEISDLAPKLGIDLSNAEVSGTDNMAETIAEQTNASVAAMIENANTVTEALQSNGGLDGQNYSLMMNSDGSFGIQITPKVDETALAESTSRGISQGANSDEVVDSVGNGVSQGVDKGTEQYGKKLGEIHADEQFSSGGAPQLGEAVTIEAEVKPKGDIDTSGINPEIEANVKANEVEMPEDSEAQVNVNAVADSVEMPQGDAGTVNVNAVADNVEVPQGDAGTVNVNAVADNVEVPDEAGSVSVDVEAEAPPEYPDQTPQVTYGINAPPPPVYPDQNPSVNYHLNAPSPPSYPNISRTVTYHINTVGSAPKYNGTANYNGTAHFGGTAYASGNWGTKKKETALVGELGMETVVYGGKFWTVGNKGAEFASIPKGAIVFNHKQTEELFKNGKVLSGGGRGNIAHANGTAFVSGTAYASGSDPTDFDFAAIKIDRLNDDINLLADTMELFDKYAKQNALAQQEIGKIHEAILANEQAYNYYLSKANEVGLDEGHVEKVKNGTIEIEAIGDDDLKKKVDNYKKWYEAALNTQSAIVKLKKELQEVSKIKLDNIEDEFQWWKDWRQAVLDRREATIDLYKEQHGHDSVGRLQDSARHYTAFISELEDRMSQLQKEINAQVASGELQKYSKAWYEATQRCVEARTEIIELQLKLEEINNTIREANWNNFNKMLDNFASLRNEMDTAYDLVGDMNPFRDDASVNANGKAQLAMLQDGLINARQEVKNYSVAYNALNKELKKGIISQDEYDEKLQDLRKDQLDAAQSVKKYRDAILDLVRDGIEKETEVFEKLISVRQENLRKQKEADDYARTVRDKTKDINDIQAQITALSGDDSIATRAQIRELEAKLQEAQQDLDDTRRDHEYDVMSKAYDKELNDFKDIQEQKLKDLDTYLDSQDAAIKDALTIIRDEYQATYRRMDNIAKLYGITLNDSILNPWVSAKKAVQEYNKAIAKPKKATVKIKTGNYVKTTKKKARGTYNASSGLTLTDEDGTEAILTKDGVLRQLDSGDTVFNARQREMLWKISKMSPSALIKPSISANLSSGNGGMNGDININYDITIEGNATESTVADIDEVCKRAAEYTKNDMVKSFRKIGIAI